MYLVNIQVENKFLSELRLEIQKYIDIPEFLRSQGVVRSVKIVKS